MERYFGRRVRRSWHILAVDFIHAVNRAAVLTERHTVTSIEATTAARKRLLASLEVQSIGMIERDGVKLFPK